MIAMICGFGVVKVVANNMGYGFKAVEVFYFFTSVGGDRKAVCLGRTLHNIIASLIPLSFTSKKDTV